MLGATPFLDNSSRRRFEGDPIRREAQPLFLFSDLGDDLLAPSVDPHDDIIEVVGSTFDDPNRPGNRGGDDNGSNLRPSLDPSMSLDCDLKERFNI